ncbi:MAG: HAD-IA family hydrolase [Magnetococcus sp. WYHC-3]
MNDAALAAPLDLVIFDCDGTLVDSLNSIATVMNRVWADLALGDPLTSAQVAGVVGLSLDAAMRTLWPGGHADLWHRMVAAYREHYSALVAAGAEEAPLFPEVRATLERLQSQGVILAVATGKSMRGLERTLAAHGLRHLFSALKTADCQPSKPHPGMVLAILEETAIPRHHALIVGDTTFDIDMGHNAGIRTCAVTYGCHSLAQLAAARPHHTIDALPAVLTLPGLAERGIVHRP